MIEVKESVTYGRGIFATRDIKEGEVFEKSPVIVIDKFERIKLSDTKLYNYYFTWSEDGAAVCLGLGSLYNHSFVPNAKYIKDFKGGCIQFIALRNIVKGEEIFVNYNGDPKNKSKKWFQKRGVQVL